MNNIVSEAGGNGKGTNGGAIKIRLGGKKLSLTPETLAATEKLEKLQHKLGASKAAIVIDIDALPTWPPAARIDALTFLSGLHAKPKYRAGEEAFGNLIDAVVALIPDPLADPEAYQVAKTAVLEAVAVCLPGALEAGCGRLQTRLKEVGVKGVRVDALLKEARGILEAVRAAATGDETGRLSIPVLEALPDAPVDDSILVPPGWRLNEHGVYRDGDDDPFAAIWAPILITERHVDIHRETELVTLAWYREGQWHTRIVDRGAIANCRSIVDALAPFGLPITSNNAKICVQYLADFEATNLAGLPVTRVSPQLGWQEEDDASGFLLGNSFITTESGSGGVKFRGGDEGDEQLAAGFHSCGNLTAWMKAIKRIRPYPQVRLVFYAAFVSVLLRIFRTPNIIVDLAGRTTTGKTTTARIVASVWGNPAENSKSSVVKTWDGTATWRERMPAVLNHLPVILDDTRHVRHREEVEKTIYSVSQGVGRGRGSVKGIARQDTWHTVLVTTGEEPVGSFTQAGGTHTRVLALWGSPFGGVSQATGKRVRAINEIVRDNYGHAGPRFVRFLLANRDKWGEWRAEYKVELRKFEEWAEDNPFAARLAPHFAAIATAAWLVHQAFGLPWEYTDPIEPLWDELAAAAAEADRARAAMQHVLDWAFAHQEEFFGRADQGREPSRGWAGRWHNVGTDPHEGVHGFTQQYLHWEWLGFIRARLYEILQQGGFDQDATLKAWAERDWLVTTTEADGRVRRTVRARVGSEPTPMHLIAIPREVVEEFMN